MTSLQTTVFTHSVDRKYVFHLPDTFPETQRNNLKQKYTKWKRRKEERGGGAEDLNLLNAKLEADKAKLEHKVIELMAERQLLGDSISVPNFFPKTAPKSTQPILQPLTGESLRLRTASSDDGARLDVSADGFWGLLYQRVFFDVRVFCPLSSTNASRSLSACYKDNKEKKKRKYD
uniref:Uncharacterized protein n=1 Tax=Amphimedon queenslandica TaxID=400682 RepID=A0A1X7T0F5_AMPQE